MTSPIPRIHIFNPDTDYALAADRRYYTPPARVLELRNRLALLPALYACKNDCILIPDGHGTDTAPEYYDEYLKSGAKLITETNLKVNPDILNKFRITPWGWNMSLRQYLMDLNPESEIPSEKEIRTLRALSHRRTSISFLNAVSKELNEDIILPQEISSVDEALELFRSDRKIYFKAPWSSSGRGILLCDDLEELHVKPWVQGTIRRQGSVIMEPAYDRILDFATEWFCKAGTVVFLGLSVFQTSRRGKYHGNTISNQENLKSIIQKAIDIRIENVIETQQGVINDIIAPYYSGPLGIDMLATKEGKINPCVEINLRHTMGMLPLLRSFYEENPPEI